MTKEGEVITKDDNPDTPEAGTPKEPDKKEPLTDEQFAALAEDKRFKELMQSEADKRQRTWEKRQQRSQQERLADLRRTREDEELDSLVNTEDYEGIGRRTADVRRQQKTLREAASMVSSEIEGVLQERPEFRALGEDRIEEIRQEVGAKGGTVVDFMVALADERQGRVVGDAAQRAVEAALKEVDARLTAAGLAKRSEGEGPDANISGGGGGTTSDSRAEDEILADPNTPTETLEKILKGRGIKVR